MKKIMIKVGAILGLIALIVLISIIASPNIAKTAPYNIIGAICFFVILFDGIPCTTLVFDPNAMCSGKKDNTETNNK